MELVYWNLRGRCLPIYMLLAYNDEQYSISEQIMPEGLTNAKSPEEAFQFMARGITHSWFAERQTLDADFPNLPHLKTDDAGIIAETTSIERYLARRHNQLGTTVAEQTKTDTFVGAYYDMWEEFRYVVNSLPPHFDRTTYKDLRESYVTGVLPQRLAHLQQRLADKKYWLGSDEPTLSDFLLYDLLDIWMRFAPEVSLGEDLAAFVVRMRSLKKLEKFFNAAPEHRLKQIFPPFAYWTGI